MSAHDPSSHSNHVHGPNCSHGHHGHAHGGLGGHSHAPSHFGRAFALGISLNVVFVAIEIFYGLKANSLALLADAGHNFSDILGLFLAWGAFWLAGKQPSQRFTYGLQSSAILAALLNALLLLVATGGIIWEALQRFSAGTVPEGSIMIGVALAGVVINGATAWLFHAGSKSDLNIKGAYLHMMADAAVSLGVVASGVLLLATGWLWLDPAISIVIAAVIIIGTWSLLRESLAMSLQGVPAHIDMAQVRQFLQSQEGVRSVHDLHVWPIGTQEVALSSHIVMANGHPGDAVLQAWTNTLHSAYGISHATIQIELGDSETECRLAPDHVI